METEESDAVVLPPGNPQILSLHIYAKGNSFKYI